jgi:hypothetical protein
MSKINHLKKDVSDFLYDKKTAFNAVFFVSTLNPIIIGTANYWSPSVAKEVFSEMDSHIWTSNISV